jgi:ABC-type transport system involved in multi-copper enzyme maturation permease subunit
MVEIAALLIAALLFGGMVLYSFGFAAFLFTALPSDIAGKTIRRGFPLFYLFVLITAALAAALTWPSDQTSAVLLALVALTTIPTRQVLMPAINNATDTGAKTRFKILHSASVLITIIHMVLVAIVLARFL